MKFAMFFNQFARILMARDAGLVGNWTSRPLSHIAIDDLPMLSDAQMGKFIQEGESS